MSLSEKSSAAYDAAERPGKVTVALVSKYGPDAIGGIQNHLGMLLRHVPDASCSYVLVSGSEGAAGRGGRTRRYLGFVRRLARSGGDVVHFHGFDRLQLLTLVMFTRGRIPVVVTPHNGLAGIVNEPSAARRLAKRWADGLLFPALIRQRARVIALSEEERDYYLTRFPGCGPLVEVLPNPVGAHDWVPLLPAPEPARLLALARLDPAKHIEDLVSAMAILPPGIECDIAGPDCGAAAALQDQARQLSRTIRFHGAVRGAEKDRLFEEAAVVVVTTEAEGLSTVALEALARGIPVVASDGAARGLPAEGVYRYRFGSVAGLAEAIEHLLAGENLVAARRAARRASGSLVGYDDYAQALRRLYRLNLQRHRSGIRPSIMASRSRFRALRSERPV